jgi:hypothetical protein
LAFLGGGITLRSFNSIQFNLSRQTIQHQREHLLLTFAFFTNGENVESMSFGSALRRAAGRRHVSQLLLLLFFVSLAPVPKLEKYAPTRLARENTATGQLNIFSKNLPISFLSVVGSRFSPLFLQRHLVVIDFAYSARFSASKTGRNRSCSSCVCILHVVVVVERREWMNERSLT